MADPTLVLLTRMAITAGVVVSASLVAERASPFLAAMIATLPLSAGPAYVFLALDHGSDFIATSALASIMSNGATTAYVLAYVAVAQRAGTALSLGAALAAWAAFIATFGQVQWSLVGALALSIGLSLGAIWLTRGARRYTVTLRAPVRAWHIAARACAVMVLVALVVLVGQWIGPRAAGLVAVLPIVFSSLVLIMQPKMGGAAVSAILAHALAGMMGYIPAFAVLHLTAVPLGALPALGVTLAVCLGWNAALVLAQRYWR